MTDITYSKRESLFEKGERAWRVTGDTLYVSNDSGHTTTIPLDTITGLRLAFAPTQLKPWRYLAVVRTRTATFEIDNCHFLGIGNFENRSAAYRAMIEALVVALKMNGARFQVAIGATAASYVVQVAFVVLAAVILTCALIITSFSAWPWTAVVKIAIILVSLPLLIRWLVRARPRRAPLDTLPPSALPPVG